MAVAVFRLKCYFIRLILESQFIVPCRNKIFVAQIAPDKKPIQIMAMAIPLPVLLSKLEAMSHAMRHDARVVPPAI